jgi:catechol 2,3-dioxygenase-like lactoylglutathione lyase family enzyme
MRAPTTTAVPALGSMVLDCPDPLALSAFYRRLLDWPEDAAKGDGDWVSLINPLGGPKLAFQRVDDYHAPDWPSPANPQQAHLDLDVADMEAAHARALDLGARLLDDEPEAFRVYADPVGHPFCLCV